MTFFLDYFRVWCIIYVAGDFMITLSKLAKLANVSVSTASKAFSLSGEVNEETRELVFKVAREQGCFKKFFSAKYPKFVIAVICPEIVSLYYADILLRLQKQLSERNCEICVATTDFSREREVELIDYYYKYSSVDGIIVVGGRSNLGVEGTEIPLVFVGNHSEIGEDKVCFYTDTAPAVSEAVDYLFERDVYDIGYIGEPLTKGKFTQLSEILKESGHPIKEDFAIISEHRFEQGGYEAMKDLLSRKARPRAVICAYDYMAIGAIRCALDKGLRVPEDIAVLGMDDIAQAEYLNPPLASITSDGDDACRLAAEAIVNRINGDFSDKGRVLPAEFKLRRSFEI